MRFSVAAAIATLAATAQASAYGNGTSYVTEVVTAYTTYCPGPTEITHGGSTITVTSATTLTITDCPCTITKPVYSSTPAPPAPTSVYTPPPPVYGNSTSAAPTYSSPTGTGAPSGTTSVLPTFTGAANKAMAASGAGLAGLFAAVAYIL